MNKDKNPTQTTAKELGINTDLAQANNQVAQTKDVKAQIQEQQQIATAIGHVQKAVETYTANQQEAAEQEVRRLKSHLEKAEQQGNQEAVNQLKKDILQAKIQAENWGTGGSTKRAVDAITNAGLIALSGGSSQSIATAAASPYVNQLIKKATEDYPALNIPTHILWGAVEAELMGGKASTGAISTAAGELGAKYLMEHLYDKKAKLTETERSQVKEIAKALAGVAGGLAAAGQGASAVKILSESSIGTTVANNAVENNALTQGDIHSAYQRLLNGENIEVVLRDLEHLSQKERDKLLADCDAACRQVVPSLLMAANDFSEEQAIAIGSVLSKIPADQRSRVDMLVQSENSKTLEAIENSKSDVEKHVALAVKVMRFFQAENAVSGGKPNKLKATSVHSENKDYSKDVANLGVKNAKFNSELNNKVTQNERYVVAPKLIVDNQKYNYLFGNVKNDSHNTSRALQNKQQLSSIGIYDDRNGREIINKSLNEALSIRNSVKDTYSKNIDGKYQRFEAREGIITGPGGIRKFESHFEIMNDGSRRLTTIIFKGGN